jgi:hypothetical protein
MILWTLEKGFMLVGGVTAGRAPIVQIIWWAIYMGAFFQGNRIEQARKATVVAPVP